MAGTSVFLTGATGYVGQSVLAELIARNLSVTALVRRQTNLQGCRTVVGELANLSSLSSEIASADAIIHLASRRSTERNSVLRDEILGTSSLIDAWRHGPSIYASSPSIYGVPRGTLKETSPLDFEDYDWFHMGLLCNEFQLRLAPRSAPRGPAITLRPGIVFAANDRRHDYQILSDLFAQCRLGAKFVFDSEEGLATYGRSFVGGADFGRLVAEALDIKVSGSYNVAGGFCTWRELIQTINRLAGTQADFLIRFDTRPQAGEYLLPQSRRLLDTSAFAAQTGFVPRQSLEELVEEFVRAGRNTQPA